MNSTQHTGRVRPQLELDVANHNPQHDRQEATESDRGARNKEQEKGKQKKQNTTLRLCAVVAVGFLWAVARLWVWACGWAWAAGMAHA